jgi:hypothetical protein
LPPETDELVGEFLKISVYPFRIMSFLSRLEQRFITLADQSGAICDNPAGYGQQRDADHQRPQAELEAGEFLPAILLDRSRTRSPRPDAGGWILGDSRHVSVANLAIRQRLPKVFHAIDGAEGKKANRKSARETKPKKLSAIDAAAQLLAGSKEPMNTRQMIEAMAAKGLWTSPGGKTPHATLYSAILREINEKGKDSRFTKTERGKFTAKAA